MTYPRTDAEEEEKKGSRHAPPRRRGRGRRRGRTLLGAAGLVAAASLAAGGVAGASPSSSAHAGRTGPTATTPVRHPEGGDRLLRHLLRGTLHAEFVVRTKSGTDETLVFDRGAVRAVTATAITIAPADTPNATVSAAITSKTRFRGFLESQLTSGDEVALVVRGGDAVVVGSRRPAPGSGAPNSPAAS